MQQVEGIICHSVMHHVPLLVGIPSAGTDAEVVNCHAFHAHTPLRGRDTYSKRHSCMHITQAWHNSFGPR